MTPLTPERKAESDKIAESKGLLSKPIAGATVEKVMDMAMDSLRKGIEIGVNEMQREVDSLKAQLTSALAAKAQAEGACADYRRLVELAHKSIDAGNQDFNTLEVCRTTWLELYRFSQSNTAGQSILQERDEARAEIAIFRAFCDLLVLGRVVGSTAINEKAGPMTIIQYMPNGGDSEDLKIAACQEARFAIADLVEKCRSNTPPESEAT